MITFLLTDVVGSTAMWDALPQAMARALVRHDALVDATVSAQRGTLIKSKGEGDSTFSVFERCSDAAAAAVALHRAMAQEAWPDDLQITVRAGIHFGEVVARDGDYYGPAVNRAARLRGLAEPGETLLSRSAAEQLMDHVEGEWHLDDLGLRSLRGLSRPEHVYRLVDPRQDTAGAGAPETAPDRSPRGDLPGALAGDGTSLVGRDDERSRLLDAWRAATEGRAGAVLVGGEPGIGKTALAADAARRARADGATVLYGRCDGQVAVAYEPFLDPLRTLLAATGGQRDDGLARRVGGLFEPVAGVADAERHALFEAVQGVLAEAAARGPVALVLDDLHWATAPTALLLGHLLRNLPPGLLVIGTYRDTEVDADHPMHSVLTDAWRVAEVERLSLRGLPVGAVVALLEVASGHQVDERGTALAARLATGTGGNPFFVRELLRHLAESGVIYEADGQWTSDVDLASVSLPSSVVDVLRQRLERLPAAALQVLTVAAVAGAEVDVDLVEAATGIDDAEVVDTLDAAVDAGLLAERDEGLVFAHALVRASLLSGLSTLRRRRWHRVLAEQLAARPPERQPVEALAHHYTEAARAEPELAHDAAAYGLAAARKAAAALAPEVALDHVGRALGALEGSRAPDLGVRCDLLLEAARASFAVVGRTDGCRRPALAAGADALAVGDPERVAQAAELALGGLVMTYDTSHELEIIERALELPVDPPLEARLVAARALALLGAGRAGDLEASAAGVASARAAADDAALVAALHARSASLLRSPDLAERLAIAEELASLRGTAAGIASRVALSPTDVELYRAAALLAAGDLPGLEAEIALLEAQYEATGDWELHYFSIAHRATLAAVRGDLDALERWADEMIAHDATRPPDPPIEGFHPISDGSSIGNNSLRLYAAYQFILHRERGLLEGLLPLFRDAVAGDPTIAVFGAALAIAEAEAGQPEAARRSFDACLANGLDALPHDQIWPLLIGCLTEACALVGAAEWADALRAEAEPFRGQISAGAIGTIVFDLFDRCLGMLDVAQQRWDDAVEHLDAAAERAHQIGAPVWEARALAWSAHAHACRGRPGDAALAAERHRAAAGLAGDLALPGLVAVVEGLRPPRS